MDPNHHLWRNGRLYWVAFTVHLQGWQKERVRLSLGTADLDEARRRRDELFLRYPTERGELVNGAEKTAAVGALPQSRSVEVRRRHDQSGSRK